jgi:hypothetical protein
MANDSIFGKICCNRLAPPPFYRQTGEPITKAYEPGDAHRKAAPRAAPKPITARFLVANAAAAKDLLDWLAQQVLKPQQQMVVDGQAYDEIMALDLQGERTIRLGKHSQGPAADGGTLAAGVGARIVEATFLIARSGEPPEEGGYG